MTEAVADDLDVHFPASAELSMDAEGPVQIRPLQLAQFVPVRRALQPLMDIFRVPVEQLPLESSVQQTVDFMIEQLMVNLDETRIEALVNFLHTSSGLTVDRVRALDLANVSKLTRTVLEVNYDFFVKTVAPELALALRTLSQILVAARGPGPTASTN